MKNLNVLKVIVLVLVTSLFTSCSSDEATSANVTPTAIVLPKYDQTAFELEVLDLVNQDRVSKGLTALILITEISHVSSTHNDYMIVNNNASHDNFESRKNTLKAGVQAISVSENVAAGYSTAQGVVNAWNASVSHKANLEGNHTHYGMSVKQDVSGKKYYTLMFIRK